jgi:hypothetical protein
MSSGTLHVAGHAAGGANTGLDADKVIPVRDVFAAARDGKAVVYLDRLCRLVHTLNYLRQTGETGSLFLHVHARHVSGVATEHGRDFERVLERCGLQPDRVVIAYTPSGNEDEDSLARIRHISCSTSLFPSPWRGRARVGERLTPSSPSPFQAEEIKKHAISNIFGLALSLPADHLSALSRLLKNSIYDAR